MVTHTSCSLIQSWLYAVNDVLVHENYPHHAKLDRRTYLIPRFREVFHVIRCPTRQISAFTAHLNQSYDFIRKHMLFQIKINPSSRSITSNQRIRPSVRNTPRNETALFKGYIGNYGGSNPIPAENSLWKTRNHSDFFRRRKSFVSLLLLFFC